MWFISTGHLSSGRLPVTCVLFPFFPCPGLLRPPGPSPPPHSAGVFSLTCAAICAFCFPMERDYPPDAPSPCMLLLPGEERPVFCFSINWNVPFNACMTSDLFIGLCFLAMECTAVLSFLGRRSFFSPVSDLHLRSPWEVFGSLNRSSSF